MRPFAFRSFLMGSIRRGSKFLPKDSSLVENPFDHRIPCKHFDFWLPLAFLIHLGSVCMQYVRLAFIILEDFIPTGWIGQIWIEFDWIVILLALKRYLWLLKDIFRTLLFWIWGKLLFSGLIKHESPCIRTFAFFWNEMLWKRNREWRRKLVQS